MQKESSDQLDNGNAEAGAVVARIVVASAAHVPQVWQALPLLGLKADLPDCCQAWVLHCI